MICEPYSVVVVPFPFTDQNQVKRRPALVLSKSEYQKQNHHVTLLMITSAKHSAWPDDYLLQHLDITGLTSSSLVRQKIFTLDIQLILERIGKLSSRDKTEVIKRLKAHLHL